MPVGTPRLKDCLGQLKPRECMARGLATAGGADYCYRPLPICMPEDLGGWDCTASAVLETELERGFTMAGPHRDDVVILNDGRSLGKFGSRGQQRTGILAWRRHRPSGNSPASSCCWTT